MASPLVEIARMTTTELSASAIEKAPQSSSKSGGAYLLIGPAVVWMTLFLVVPMAMIVYVSFWTQTTFKIESTLTLAMPKPEIELTAADSFAGRRLARHRNYLRSVILKCPGGAQ